jgi:hypothetical protein
LHTGRILEEDAYLVVGEHVGNAELLVTLLPVHNLHLSEIVGGGGLLELQFQLGPHPLIILLLGSSE